MGLLLGVPIILLNVFGGVASAIWLGASGEWSAVGIGLGAIFFGAIAISLLMIPGIIFAVPAVKAFDSGNITLAKILTALSLSYTFGIFSLWGYFVYLYFIENIPWDLRFPGVVWSYAVVTASVGFLASKERDNPHSQTSAAIFSLTCIIAMFVAYNVRYDSSGLFWVFAVGAGASLFFSMAAVNDATRYGNRPR